MDHPDTRLMPPQEAKRPPSREVAMAIPEILSNVLSFADQFTLYLCFRVSPLWRTCSLPFFWRSVRINVPNFVSRFYPPDESESKDDDDKDQHKNEGKNENENENEGKDEDKDENQVKDKGKDKSNVKVNLKDKDKDEDNGEDSDEDSEGDSEWDSYERYKESPEEIIHKRQKHLDNCHHIRSLTLMEPINKGWLEMFGRIIRPADPQLPDSMEPQAAGLKNLSRLSVHSTIFRPWAFGGDNLPTLYQVVHALIKQNPGLQDLDWHVDMPYAELLLVDLVLKKMGGHLKNLKKLSVSWSLTQSRLECLLKYIMKAYEKRLEQQALQEPLEEKLPLKRLTIAQGSLDDPSLADKAKSKNKRKDAQEKGDDRGDFQLDELVLKDPKGPGGGAPGDRHRSQNMGLEWLRFEKGVLPIRSLTLMNIETAFYRERDTSDSDSDYRGSDSENAWDYDESREPDDSLPALLSKCPNLEELRVTFDLYRNDAEPSVSFLNLIEEEHHFLDEFYLRKRGVIWDENFAYEMHKSCPKLRELELGMFYQVKTDQWVELMGYYRQQLESLSIWGNVIAFTSEALLTLIGPPLSNPSKDGLHCLTRLNINGMRHLHDSAWMALFHLPLLKEFRARDVPLDARELTSEESWACKGLEVLEIFVLIPKRTQWQWFEKGGRWVKDMVRYQKETATTAETLNRPDGKNTNDGDQKHTRNPLKRPAMDSTTEDKPSKRANTGPTPLAIEKLTDPRASGVNIHTQIKVCKMIGQLTHLRELRLEGNRDYQFNNRDWHCLELTLETGLDCLAPLRENLEKLILSQLSDGLHAGRKEIEWIARNWVHYNNPQWKEKCAPKASQPRVPSQGKDEPQKGRTTSTGSKDDSDLFAPTPKFNDLIGLRSRVNSENLRKASANIDWLAVNCPTLELDDY